MVVYCSSLTRVLPKILSPRKCTGVIPLFERLYSSSLITQALGRYKSAAHPLSRFIHDFQPATHCNGKMALSPTDPNSFSRPGGYLLLFMNTRLKFMLKCFISKILFDYLLQNIMYVPEIEFHSIDLNFIFSYNSFKFTVLNSSYCL